jgi:S1-C subfamily serine protease
MPRLVGRMTIAGILSFAMLAVAPAAARAQDEKIYGKILKSTVWIVIPLRDKATKQGVPIRMGTGTLVDAQQKIVLTNFHVAGQAEEIYVFFPAYGKDKRIIPERQHYLDMVKNGGGIKASTVARESKVDLALLKLQSVPEGAQAMPLAKDPVSPAQSVHSVGNPGASGALWVYTPGKVRQVYQKQFRSGGEGIQLDIDARVVETNSETNPGDSGGPLVNDRCELVGVTQGGATNAQAVSTFIDVSEVKKLLQKANIKPLIASGTTPESPKEKTGEDRTAAAAKAAEAKERQATGKLKLAKQLADSDKEGAAQYCEEILAKFPDTKAASEAKTLLGQLKKK